MTKYLNKFLYIIAGKRNELLLLIGLFLVTSVLEAFGIGFIGPFIALATDTSLIHQNSYSEWIYTQFNFGSEIDFVVLLGLVVVAILWLKSILGFNVQKYIFGFGFGQQADLRTRLMRAYLKVPYTFHLSRNTASLIQNILNETLVFANGILMPTLFAGANLAIVIALLILLFITDAIVTATVLIVLLFVFAVIYRFRSRVATWGKEASAANKKMVQIINHGMGGFKETRIIGCEAYFEKQLDDQAQMYKEVVEKFQAFSLLPRYTLEPVLISLIIGFTIISLLTNQDLNNLTATLGVFGLASVRLLPAASNLMQSYGGIKRSSYVVDLLYNDLKELETLHIQDYAELGSKSEIKFDKLLSIEKLNYVYPNASELALDDISISIKKGESIGLIGKSGAGKTTIVDIILGLLPVQNGDFKIDSISIKNNLHSWQNKVGYIPQSIFLIDDTLERNIAFGVEDHKIDRYRLERAIEAAQLTEVVARLPQGMKTVVGERGVLLSGGQRQRVGIARALYHEREVLVLDEATAALDNETEYLVSKAIESLSGTKTIIIIAHRLTTVKHCNCIYLMEKGQIVKSGSYEEVVLENPVSH
ncbi:ABC transporter ATP-binding protein [Pleurocapsa sp. PCC 7319]|uniref:ABC transporter ATP-binding protein n=1 Tax=Pleurocapsa sp. PCC 7319 TaxID=118161 RepID=UPI00034516FE|nr:ABC transporter ATP-binding protein [Pleurocapsa sp. PCC 7319]